MLIHLKIAIIIGLFLTLSLLERLFPYRTIKQPSRHWLANLGLWGINSLLSSVFIIGFTASLTYLTPPSVVMFRLSIFPNQWWALLADCVIYDCYIYWWHRLNHLVPWLWRFHRVHHLDENLDTTTAVRFHWGEVLLSCFWRAPLIILLGMPLSSVLVAEILLLCLSLFQHSNLNLPKKLDDMLKIFIVTPTYHFLHHEPDRRNTDSHYANILTIWDKLFASRAHGMASKKMKHGLPGLHDMPLPKLLFAPFVNVKKIKQWGKS
ncbi:MAG: sterol desaturase family protein [Hydrotalea sp.]|nr:sterol desaturase family protein [Hydrotalea sp.]